MKREARVPDAADVRSERRLPMLGRTSAGGGARHRCGAPEMHPSNLIRVMPA